VVGSVVCVREREVLVCLYILVTLLAFPASVPLFFFFITLQPRVE